MHIWLDFASCGLCYSNIFLTGELSNFFSHFWGAEKLHGDEIPLSRVQEVSKNKELHWRKAG